MFLCAVRNDCSIYQLLCCLSFSFCISMLRDYFSVMPPPCSHLFSYLFSPLPLSQSLDTPLFSFSPFSCLSVLPIFFLYTSACPRYTHILYCAYQQKACLLHGLDSHISLPSSLHPFPFYHLLVPLLLSVILLNSQVYWMLNVNSKPGIGKPRERR